MVTHSFIQKSAIGVGVVVFSISSVAKYLTLLLKHHISSGHVLDYPNPVFQFLSNESVFALAATMEMSAVVLAIVFYKKGLYTFALGWIAWIASMLALYRIALGVMGLTLPCNCLGTLGKIIFTSDQTATKITAALLYLVLTCSYMGLIFSFLTPRVSRWNNQTIKINATGGSQ